MEQVYQRGRELFFLDGRPLPLITIKRFRTDFAEGSLATVEVFWHAGQMETFELMPEPPSAVADPRLEGCHLFALGTGFDPSHNTYVTEAQAFMVLNGTLRRNQKEDIKHYVTSEERARSSVDLDQVAMEDVVHQLSRRMLKRAKPSPEYMSWDNPKPTPIEDIREAKRHIWDNVGHQFDHPTDRAAADAVRKMKRKQVPQFQFVRNPARARKHAMQALSLDQSQYHGVNERCNYCGSPTFNSGPNHSWFEAHCDRCGREVVGELLEAIQVATTPKRKTLLPADQHSLACVSQNRKDGFYGSRTRTTLFHCKDCGGQLFVSQLECGWSESYCYRCGREAEGALLEEIRDIVEMSRAAAPANLLEPGKAKFTNAPKGTILRVDIEVSGRKTTIAQTMGHTIVLPSIPLRSPGHIDRVTIKAHHPDGLQSHERHCHPANYRALQKDGFVHQLAWNNPKEHEGAFSNVPTDLGDAVKRVTGHFATVNGNNLEKAQERCPECKGTRIYNCPFKGPVPCSLCGGN